MTTDHRMVRLVAAARQMYDGRLLLPGQTFSARETDAADLCAMNFARRAPALLQTAAIRADDEQETAKVEPKRTRRYRRRDMRAEK